MEAYAADKARVFANQGPDDVAVIDVDDAGSRPYAEAVAARGVRVVRVSRERLLPGGASIVDGRLTLDTADGELRLVHVDDLLIKGSHNVGNALAAAAAAVALGVTEEAVRAGLRTFEPIEHRLEPVGEVRGVEYFNDSKATNPDAVSKALTAFEGRGLVVLLGGLNKGNDFRPLAEEVATHCRAAVLFGAARPELEAAFEGLDVRVETAEGLLDALHVASGLAEQGDAVLLSPACASFDEFTSYEHRGRVFKEAVRGMTEGTP
jgi:UDP-N-acetylmuramoylalanine--D-glutamate ligase